VTGAPARRPLDHGRQPAVVSRSVHLDHILHSPLLAPCSALWSCVEQTRAGRSQSTGRRQPIAGWPRLPHSRVV